MTGLGGLVGLVIGLVRLVQFARFSWIMIGNNADVCRRILTYADVCYTPAKAADN